MTVVSEIVAPKHDPSFYKGSMKTLERRRGFMTPNNRGFPKPEKKHNYRARRQSTNPLQDIADKLTGASPHHDERTTQHSEISFPRGCFESGNKPKKILKSVLLEGRVLFSVEWKKEKNKLQPLNTLISEEKLKKSLKPRTYKKLLNKYLAEE